MKILSMADANLYLAKIEMVIGRWNEIAEFHETTNTKKSWINIAAPDNCHELLTFSQYLFTWIPKGAWILLQIDNSTTLDFVQSAFVQQLLSGSQHNIDFDLHRSFLFEYEDCGDTNNNISLLITNIIYLFLLFNAHVTFASENSLNGERLSLQDGFAYLISRNDNNQAAQKLLSQFKLDPQGSPDWIIKISERSSN